MLKFSEAANFFHLVPLQRVFVIYDLLCDHLEYFGPVGTERLGSMESEYNIWLLS